MSNIDNSYSAVATTFGVPALVVAYFLQPDVAIMNTGTRAGFAMIAIGLLVALAAVFDLTKENWSRVILATGAITLALFAWQRIIAPYDQSWIANDRRCLAIQRDMLSALPQRADGPDLFQALGCRPQGEGSVYAPRIKKGSGTS